MMSIVACSDCSQQTDWGYPTWLAGSALVLVLGVLFVPRWLRDREISQQAKLLVWATFAAAAMSIGILGFGLLRGLEISGSGEPTIACGTTLGATEHNYGPHDNDAAHAECRDAANVRLANVRKFAGIAFGMTVLIGAASAVAVGRSTRSRALADSDRAVAR